MTDAGQIKYTVAADTGDLLKAADITDKAIDSMVTDLQRVDRAADSMASSVNQSARQVQTQMTRTAQAVESGMGGMGQAAQNFSYQIQDIAVQLAGGQSPFLVMAQQIPQMLVGFGAAAAGVGALVAVLGGLYLAFGDTTTSLEKFEKALERAQAVITIGVDGVANYSDEMRKLAHISETLANLKLTTTLTELERGMREGALSLQDLTKDATNTITLFKSFDDVVKEITGKRAGADGFEEASAAVKEFNFAVAAFVAQRTPENVDALEQALKRLADSGATATKTGHELVASAVDLVGKFRESVDITEKLKDGLTDIDGEGQKARSSIDAMVESLRNQAATIAMTERETAIYAATLKGATDADKEAINAAYDKIEAYKAEQEAQKARAQALDDYNAAVIREAEAEERKRQAAGQFATGIANRGVDRGALELEQLAEFYTQKQITTAQYEAAITQIQQEQADKRKQIEQEEAKTRLMQQNAILSSSAQFFGAAADLIGQAAGEQSAAYKVMYGISKGFAIAQASLNLMTAISNASALPWPANIPAMAQAAASGAALVSGIGGLSYGGGRQFGGGVGAGSYYRVGEAGPEIYQTSSGRNYMIPGENGKVIPNDGIGSTVNVDVRVQNYGGQPVDVQRSQSGDGTNRTEVINIIVGDILSGGKTRNAITRATTAKNRVT